MGSERAAKQTTYSLNNMARITLIAALFGGAAAQSTVGLWQKIAGYESASDVEQHSKIDLDMQELEDKVGEYDTNANWKTEALSIFDNGGNGVCVNDNDNGIGCVAGGAWGNSLKSSEIRTLKGFATKDYAALTGDYAEKLPPIYTAYWTANGMTAAEAAVWADTFVRKDYSAISKDAGSNQLMKKGANYQAVWMYVLHELEDAIGDCKAGDISKNDCAPGGGAGLCGNAPHAWDEGWAFYAGSTCGATAAEAVTDDGTLIWELAEKRADDFGTDDTTGPSSVNVKILAEFIKGRDLIIAGSCDAADPGKNALTATDGCVKSWAEGWAFAAAVLPQLNQCSASAATTVKTALDIAATGPMAGGFAAVKAAVESTYGCLGISCTDIGKYSTTTACTDPSSDAATAPALALGAAAAAAGAALLL